MTDPRILECARRQFDAWRQIMVARGGPDAEQAAGMSFDGLSSSEMFVALTTTQAVILKWLEQPCTLAMIKAIPAGMHEDMWQLVRNHYAAMCAQARKELS